MTTSSPPTELSFSQVREDPLLDLAVVAGLGRPVRALVVASGGCTVLGLLGHETLQSVRAVDPNPAQLHLLALRLAAAEGLDLDQTRILLGLAPGDRGAIYDALRPGLAPETRAWWDARPDQVGWGLNQVGRFEALFRDLAARVRQETGLDPLVAPRQTAAHPAWAPCFERTFARGDLARVFGPAAVDYSMDRSFGDHFADVFARAAARFQPAENYFWQQVWGDSYGPPSAGRPPALTVDGAAAVRSRAAGRLILQHGPFEDALAHGPFDFVQTSNISDWMPVPALLALLEQVAAALAPGGAWLGRRLNGDHDLQALAGRVLDVDSRECADLLARDRSFFYREVVVGRRRVP